MLTYIILGWNNLFFDVLISLVGTFNLVYSDIKKKHNQFLFELALHRNKDTVSNSESPDHHSINID